MLQKKITTFELRGDWEKDIKTFLLQYNHLFTYEHSVCVANKAREIAKRFQVNEEQAAACGYLHDISAIFPNDERIAVVEKLGIEILQEEREFPMIIHQKISKVIAKKFFKVEDGMI